MTCEEGRKIISAVTVHNDKLVVLDCIKRYAWKSPFEKEYEPSLAECMRFSTMWHFDMCRLG